MKRRTHARPILRFIGRITASALALLVFTLVGIQFARVIGENVTMARDLSSVRSDIATLHKRRAEQRREIARLRDPQGVVPEIHDRLRMVRPNEAIIFIKPAPSSAP
ncbi:MAG: septum formation initiator family protein [Candidatus Tumulicola sp.]